MVPNMDSQVPNVSPLASAVGPLIGNTNVVGLVPDLIWHSSDGSIAAGSNQFTSAAQLFYPTDVRKFIVIAGAGPGGAPLATTIPAQVISSAGQSTITIGANASTSVPAISMNHAQAVVQQSGLGSYAPGDSVTLTRGGGAVILTNPVMTVTMTFVIGISISNPGSGGAAGACILQGTTGAGLPFQVNGTVGANGALSGLGSISFGGAYTGNPASLPSEPVNPIQGGASLVGATVSLVMGILTASVANPGLLSVAGSGQFTQLSTTGNGTGATFDNYTTGNAFWYYGSDNAPALNTAMASVASTGGKIQLPAGGIGVASPIEFPTSTAGGIYQPNPSLIGQGLNDTIIFALASMANVVHRAASSTQQDGGGVRDLTVDAFMLATNGVNIEGNTRWQVYERVVSRNASNSNWKFGNVVNSCYGLFIDHIVGYTDPFIFPASMRATYNFNGTATFSDSMLTNSEFWNASDTNLLNVQGNRVTNNNVYGYPYPEYNANYGIQTQAGSEVIGNECGGATIAAFYNNGPGGVYIDNKATPGGWTLGASACVLIASGAKAAVSGCYFNALPNGQSAPAQVVVQAGTSHADTQVWGNPGALYSFGTPPSMIGALNLNGDFVLDQIRAGAQATPLTLTYACDRWRLRCTQASKLKTQQVTTSPPSGYNHSLNLLTSAAFAPGPGDRFTIYQQVETTFLEGMGWGAAGALPLVFDFWAEASIAGQYSVAIRNATASFVIPYTITTPNTWQHFIFLIPGPTQGTWTYLPNNSLFIDFDLGSGSTFNSNPILANQWQPGVLTAFAAGVDLVANLNATLNIGGVHLKPGPTYGTYQPRSWDEELQRVKRYYQKSFPYGTAPAQNAGVVGALSLQNPFAAGEPSEYVTFNPPMVVIPTTFTTYNPSAGNANWRDVTGSADVTVSVDPSSAMGTNGVMIGTGATVATIAHNLCIHWTADCGV